MKILIALLGLFVLPTPTTQPSPSATAAPSATVAPTPTPTLHPTFPHTAEELSKQEKINKEHAFFPFKETRAWLKASYKKGWGKSDNLVFKLLKVSKTPDEQGVFEVWEIGTPDAPDKYKYITIMLHVTDADDSD